MLPRSEENLARVAAIGLAITLLAIGIGSLSPRLGPPGHHQIDKLIHLTAYAVPGILAAFAARRRPAFLALICGICLFGGAIELAQSLVPGRASSVFDAAANAVGAAIGAGIGRWVAGLWRAGRSRPPAPHRSL